MAFNSDSSVTINATVAGPFQNATYVAVTNDKNMLLFERFEQGKGAIPAGQSRLVPIEHPFTVPFDASAKGVSVFVVFLEGNEKYVGEPGPSRSFELSGRGPTRSDRSSRLVSKYATGKYWAQTERLK